MGMRWVLLSGLAVLQILSVLACSSTPKATEPVGGNPWFRSARTGDITIMRGMIAGGQSVDAQSSVGSTALMVASRAGGVETVEWLLQQGADAAILDQDGQSALVYALVGSASGPKLERLVELLIKAGANPFKFDVVGFQPVREMLALNMDRILRGLTYKQTKPCDLVERRTGEETLSQSARRLELVGLAEFFEEQGCW
ncbi:MAG: ankyrin repeat domain-containing protein [Bdellovibrionales bacterium]|nr:ankyrin repeat domain-containing protein [Bdellovibrionales bacterium]